jgi:hypothetical protein
MDSLKLFVLGEHSPNPDDWHSLRRAIVIAHNEEEALSLHDCFDTAVEVPMDRPRLLESIIVYPEY